MERGKTMLKIWITGAAGQIGQAINQILDPLDYEVINTDRDELDVSDVQAVLDFGGVNHPDVIINCAGMTDFDECQENRKKAFLVNAIGARNLSLVAAKLSAKIIQLSTDDVFDGKKQQAYSEFDLTNPLSIYGQSKLAGENYVREFTSKHFILRSTWVYGEGDNFVNDCLKKMKQQEVVVAPIDQFGSPTSAAELAKFILYLINTTKYGTYHATCQGVCSRYQLALKIAELAKKQAMVKEQTMDELIYANKKPVFSTLENFVLELDHHYQFPSWEQALADYLGGQIDGE